MIACGFKEFRLYSDNQAVVALLQKTCENAESVKVTGLYELLVLRRLVQDIVKTMIDDHAFKVKVEVGTNGYVPVTGTHAYPGTAYPGTRKRVPK